MWDKLTSWFKPTAVQRFATRVGARIDDDGRVALPEDTSEGDVATAVRIGEPALRAAIRGRAVTFRDYEEAGYFRDPETGLMLHPAGDEEGARLLSLSSADRLKERLKVEQRARRERHAMGVPYDHSLADAVEPEDIEQTSPGTWRYYVRRGVDTLHIGEVLRRRRR